MNSAKFLKTAFFKEHLFSGCYCFLFKVTLFFKISIHDVTDVILIILLVEIICVKQTVWIDHSLYYSSTNRVRNVYCYNSNRRIHVLSVLFLKKTGAWKLYLGFLAFYSQPMLSIPNILNWTYIITVIYLLGQSQQ